MPQIPENSRKFVLVTADWAGLGFAVQEVQKNGSDVIIAAKPKHAIEPEKRDAYAIQGEGLVETVPLKQVMSQREKYRDWYWIWDGNHNTDEGETLIEEGFKVFGGSEFTYELENDREAGVEYAQDAGLTPPPSFEFMTAEEGISFLEQNEDKAYVVKPNASEESHLTQPFSRTVEPKNANIEARKYLKAMNVTDYILQERKKGIEVNVEIFFSKGIPVYAQANLEDKYRHNGDLGYPSGCAFDLCWKIPMNCKLVQQTVAKFIPDLALQEYTGFADANVIIGDDEIWFLEFCFRLGYNAHPNLFTTISKKTALQTIADLIDRLPVESKSGFGASVTMFSDKECMGLPIYVPESLNGNFYLFDGYRGKEDTYEEYSMGGFGKEIAIVTAFDYTPETALEHAVENAYKVKFCNADFRTDCAKTDYPLSLVRRYEALCAMGMLECDDSLPKEEPIDSLNKKLKIDNKKTEHVLLPQQIEEEEDTMPVTDDTVPDEIDFG